MVPFSLHGDLMEPNPKSKMSPLRGHTHTEAAQCIHLDTVKMGVEKEKKRGLFRLDLKAESYVLV